MPEEIHGRCLEREKAFLEMLCDCQQWTRTRGTGDHRVHIDLQDGLINNCQDKGIGIFNLRIGGFTYKCGGWKCTQCKHDRLRLWTTRLDYVFSKFPDQENHYDDYEDIRLYASVFNGSPRQKKYFIKKHKLSMVMNVLIGQDKYLIISNTRFPGSRNQYKHRIIEYLNREIAQNFQQPKHKKVSINQALRKKIGEKICVLQNIYKNKESPSGFRGHNFQDMVRIKKILKIEHLDEKSYHFYGKFPAQFWKSGDKRVRELRKELQSINQELEKQSPLLPSPGQENKMREILGELTESNLFKPSQLGIRFLCGENISFCLADSQPSELFQENESIESNAVLILPRSSNHQFEEVRT